MNSFQNGTILEESNSFLYMLTSKKRGKNENGRAGLPWSGKNIWKMKVFPGQGKVREFYG